MIASVVARSSTLAHVRLVELVYDAFETLRRHQLGIRD